MGYSLFLTFSLLFPLGTLLYLGRVGSIVKMSVFGNSFMVMLERDPLPWRKDQVKAIGCKSFGEYLWISLSRAARNCISTNNQNRMEPGN